MVLGQCTSKEVENSRTRGAATRCVGVIAGFKKLTAVTSTIAYFFPSNSFLTAANSSRLASLTFGYCNFIAANVSITAAATITRVNHLLSAGTTYQGEFSEAVSQMVSSYASM